MKSAERPQMKKPNFTRGLNQGITAKIMPKYSWKKTAIKVVKLFLIYGVPFAINAFELHYPAIANLTISAGLHLAYDVAKQKYGLRLP